jgi:hypothetical protein
MKPGRFSISKTAVTIGVSDTLIRLYMRVGLESHSLNFSEGAGNLRSTHSTALNQRCLEIS